jgi:hypothetical protein
MVVHMREPCSLCRIHINGGVLHRYTPPPGAPPPGARPPAGRSFEGIRLDAPGAGAGGQVANFQVCGGCFSGEMARLSAGSRPRLPDRVNLSDLVATSVSGARGRVDSGARGRAGLLVKDATLRAWRVDRGAPALARLFTLRTPLLTPPPTNRSRRCPSSATPTPTSSRRSSRRGRPSSRCARCAGVGEGGASAAARAAAAARGRALWMRCPRARLSADLSTLPPTPDRAPPCPTPTPTPGQPLPV